MVASDRNFDDELDYSEWTKFEKWKDSGYIVEEFEESATLDALYFGFSLFALVGALSHGFGRYVLLSLSMTKNTIPALRALGNAITGN